MKNRLIKTLLAGAACAAMLTVGAYAEEAVSEAVTEAAEEVEAVTEAAEEDDENYETGDASLDNIRNQDEIGKNEILVVSFGTSFNDSRRLTIGAIEDQIEEAYPDWSVRRAFTAQIVIDHIEKRDGYHIDNVTEALERAVDNGVENLVVQPTHLMAGFEYEELEEQLAEYADVMNIYLAVNLLDTEEDCTKVINAITDATAEYDDGKTAIVFMGHGTEAESNGIYAKLQEMITGADFENYYIGTVEATPSLDDVIAAIADKGYERVILRPLMVVAGDHANNDMEDPEDPESWYSILTAEGYDVECVLEGLGQIEAIRDLYVEHCADAIALVEE